MKSISNLVLKDTIERNDIKAVLKVYEHPSNARVVRICNEDKEKFFCAVFRTSVSDSTGVPHILEHSVLSGSKKYPISDPFVTLIKTSMPTFLNAMTYPDKTLYPVGSANFQDFYNLSDVYLDTVFNPLLTKETFEREGWRYEFDKAGKLKYQGVVFNEMKGAFSDVERYIIDDGLISEIYPDNEYRFCSGGDPLEIPKLTYVNYINFFKDKYHPANSLILLYGDMDEAEELKVLDNINSYLDQFKPSVLLPVVTKSKEFKSRAYTTKLYQAAEGADNIYTNIVYRFENTFDGTVASLISSAFFGDTRECYKELMATGLIERFVHIGVENDLLQPYLGVTLELKKQDSSKILQSIIEKHISKAIKDGIDIEYLQGLVNRMEYAYIENLDNNGFGTINEFARRFGKNEEFLNINYYDILDKVKSIALDQEKLSLFLQSNFIDNKNSLICEFHPDPEYNSKREEIETLNLSNVEKNLDKKTKEEIMSKSKLIEAGNKDDESVIPRLKLKDLDQVIVEKEMIIDNEEKFDFIYSDKLEKKTGKINFIFGVDNEFDKANIYFLDLIFTHFFNYPTKDLNAIELENYLKNNFGTYAAAVDLRLDSKVTGGLSFGFLKEKSEAVDYIIKQLLGDRKFNDKELLLNMVNNALGQLQYTIKNESEEIIAEKLNIDIYDTEYYDYYSMAAQEKALLDIKAMIESDFDLLSVKMNEVFNTFKSNLNMSASYIGPDELITTMKSNVKDLSVILNTKPYKPNKLNYKLKKETPPLIKYQSQDIVNFHRQSLNVVDLDDNKGALYLISKICTYEYLWTEIRSKGGAYGVGLRYAEQAKLLTGYTYRDPKGIENENFVHNALNFITNLNLDEQTFESYKVSTVNGYNPYRNVESQFSLQNKLYFSATNSLEERNKVYTDILTCTQEELKELAKKLLAKPIQKIVSLRI